MEKREQSSLMRVMDAWNKEMNNVLETSFRKRTLGPQGWTLRGTLYKKKANSSLYKITSVIKEGKSPVVWQERSFQISEDGVLSYSKSSSTKIHSLEVRECFLRLGSPFQDQHGGFHVHVHTVDGAPTPFTFELGLKMGLESNWLLCARNEREFIDWIRCILSHMYPIQNEPTFFGPAPSGQPIEAKADQQTVRATSPLTEEGNLVTKSVPPMPRTVFGLAEDPPSSMRQQGSSAWSSSQLGIAPFQNFSVGPVSWIRALEGVAAFSLLNVLISLLLLSPPNSLEAWLFAGAVNLLVAFGALVRLEQIAFSAEGLVLLQKSMSSANVRSLNQHGSSALLTTTSVERRVAQNQQSSSQGADSSAEDDNTEDVTSAQHDPFLATPSPALVTSPRSQSKRLVGASSLRFVNSVHDEEAPPKHSSSQVDATKLLVRVGPNYKRLGKKAPSQPALMKLIACDLYYAKDKIDNAVEKLIFPEPSSVLTQTVGEASTPNAACRPLPGGLPHFLVFNIQVQDQGPTLFGGRASSGYSLMAYFEPTQEFSQEVANLTEGKPCSNASRLLHAWLTTSHSDITLKERLKLKATVMNEDANDILGWVSRYNGKPAMITKSNTMKRSSCRTQSNRACEVVECDVDLRMWNLLFRQGLSTVLPMVGKLTFNLALVVEGEEEDELPERILGAVRLNYLDLSLVTPWQ